jgi:hypothetical protein
LKETGLTIWYRLVLLLTTLISMMECLSLKAAQVTAQAAVQKAAEADINLTKIHQKHTHSVLFFRTIIPVNRRKRVMFGYVLVNKPELKIKEFEKYRSYYCGLCHALGERHGQTGRLTLNYDMTFLIMLLSDLYDEEETVGEGRCIVHPVQKHTSRRTAATDYCADMCLLLAYYKCQDDWNDEKKVSARASMTALKGRAEKIAAQYPQKADLIAKKMNMLTIVESAKDLPMDKVAKVFGEIMA